MRNRIFWLFLFLGITATSVRADPVVAILSYYDSTATPGYHPAIRNDGFPVRLRPADFGIDSLIITGLWFKSALVGPVPIALCEDNGTPPPYHPEWEHFPGDTISAFTHDFSWGQTVQTVAIDSLRWKGERDIWVAVQYVIDGVPFFSSEGNPAPPVDRSLGHMQSPSSWWSDDHNNWAVGLVVVYEAPVGIEPGSNPPSIPKTMVLHQNYPNPFNPQTTIAFSLAKPSPVIFSVYDLRGRLVETLLNTPLSPGDHQVIWKGGDSPSGTYFYELWADQEVMRKKMSLLK